MRRGEERRGGGDEVRVGEGGRRGRDRVRVVGDGLSQTAVSGRRLFRNG